MTPIRLVIRASVVVASLSVLSVPATASAQESLTVTFDTSSTGNPQFNNQNIVAVWVEDNLGNYVNTIGRWSNSINHRRYLFDWLSASNRPEDNPVPDGYMGGTFADYQTGLMITWDLTNPARARVPDGVYTVRMELADRNAGSAADNNEGSFTFDKNGVSATVTGSDGGFNNVTLAYVAPDPTDCGNGTIDPGETCDDGNGPMCPIRCDAETGDACMVDTFRGSALECTAECVIEPVIECVSDDGCCPAGCTSETDTDCESSGNASGACNAAGGGAGSGLGALLFALGLIACRRRRR